MIDSPMNRLCVKRGVELPHSKLTDEDVLMIRELIAYREGLVLAARQLTSQKIAEKFGVHRRTIERLAQGETWGHIE